MRLLFTLLFAVPMYAGTYNVLSCQRGDVNAAINNTSPATGGSPQHLAVDGDIINVPSGSCTWTSGITVPSNIGISIIGAGSGSVTIIDNIAGSYLFQMHPTYGNSTSRISGFTLQPQSGTGTGTPIGVFATCTASGCPNLRVDHNVFTGGWSQASLGAYSLIWATNVFGVLDHNTLQAPAVNTVYALANISHAGYLSATSQFGDSSWSTAPSFGTANELYLEDNTFGQGTFGTDCDHSDSVADVGGCRQVGRFNTFNEPIYGAPIQNHGTESTGRPRGGYSMEVYGNHFTCSGNCPAMVGVRSGLAYVFGNTFTYNSGVSASGYVGMSNYRSYNAFAPWGTCDGSSAYDQNDGGGTYSTVYASGTHTGSSGTSVLTDSSKTGGSAWTLNQWQNLTGSPYSIRNTTQGWGAEIASNGTNTVTGSQMPFLNWGNQGLGNVTWTNGDSYQILRATVCLDQPGQGGPSTLLSGNTPAPASWSSETLIPVREWADLKNGTWGGSPGQGQIYVGSLRVIHNRDFYYENFSQAAQSSATSPFNGTNTIGMGHGTIANRPTTCTAGVGYWSTNEGSWNQSSNTFPDGSSQGRLYVCSATNTWTLAYTPYTYPHPLTASGVAPTITTPSPLPAGPRGSAYSQAVAATGDVTITWTLTAGSLPAGLSGCNSVTGPSCTISGTPTTAGTSSFTLQAANSSGSNSVTFSLTVTAPIVSLDNVAHNFGNQVVNVQSAGFTFNLTNTGNAVLVITSITPSGDFTSPSNCPITPSTLGIGSSCTITGFFTPTITGIRSGSISIVDNAVDTPQGITLSGTGVPAVSGSVSTGIFGGQVIIQ